eukprot:gene8646-11687_t
MSSTAKANLANSTLIIVSSKLKEIDTNHEANLRKCGYIVKGMFRKSSSNAVHLALSVLPKQVAKIATENLENSFEKPIYKYPKDEQIIIMNAALKQIMSLDFIQPLACWISQDQNFIQTHIIGNKDHKILFEDRIDNISDYHGTKLALYFGFLRFYTTNLKLPAVFGLVLTLHQYFTNNVDSFGIPFYCIGISLWGSYVLEFWKRKANEYSYQWKVFGMEDLEVQIELAKASRTEKSNRILRQMLSICGTLTMIISILYAMLFFYDQKVHADEIYGKDSYMKYYPLVAYSFVPIISAQIFIPVATKLNDMENNLTKVEAENSLIFKLFALQFVNSYCALLYTAFWLQDLELLRSLLISLLTTGAIVNNVTESIAVVKDKIFSYFKKKPTAMADDATVPSNQRDPKIQKLLEEEANLPVSDINDDYLELIIQFGYMTMFTAVLPITPCLAFLNNIFEEKLDLFKYNSSRRVIMQRSNIGAWEYCLQFLTFFSVFTNCFLLAMVSTHIGTIVPQQFHHLIDNQSGKFIVMLIIEHLLLLVKAMMMGLIDDVPRAIREAVANDKYLEYQATITSRKENLNQLAEESLLQRQQLAAHASDSADGMNYDKFVSRSLERSSSSININEENLQIRQKNVELKPSKIPLKSKVNAEKLSGYISSIFQFNPISISILAFFPIVLQYFNISPYVYIPLALAFLCYYQSIKDYHDRKAAIGIITDPAVLQFINQEIPAWLVDSEVERVEWFNTILAKIWPYLSKAIESEVKKDIQKAINEKLPSQLTCFEILKLSLGSIPLKIVSVRVYNNAHNPSEANLRLDVDVKYAGDAKVAVQVGLKGFPLSLEISNIILTSLLRVELLNLHPVIPCISAISVTCMKKPYFDFAFKVGSFDITKIGMSSESNLTAFLRTIVHNILTTIALYPNRFVIPLMKGADVNSLGQVEHVGLLRLTVINAINLIVANTITRDADPFVTITSSNQVYQTATKSHTLKPIWNETFELLVYDFINQEVELIVYDQDKVLQTGKLTFLGKYTFKIGDIIANGGNSFLIENKACPLIDVNSGIIYVNLEYVNFPSKRDVSRGLSNKVGVPSSPGVNGRLAGVLSISSIKLLDYDGNASANKRWPSYIGFDREVQMPYISFRIGKHAKATSKSLPGEINPIYKEKIFFSIDDQEAQENQTLVVKALDKTSMSHSIHNLGKVIIPIKHLYNNHKTVENEQSYPLIMSDTRAQMSVSFKMQWNASTSDNTASHTA